MRIVVDANVFVGACLGSVSCGGVLRACIDGRAVPLMGTTLLAEFEDVLGRQQLFQRSRLSAEERNDLLDIVLAHCQWVRIFYGWRPNLPDEGDNHLVELAIAGGAAAIVTRNIRDLSRPDLLFPDLASLSPDQFLALLP
jgi:putative PIN family toxin of toxin-antitoxin system